MKSCLVESFYWFVVDHIYNGKATQTFQKNYLLSYSKSCNRTMLSGIIPLHKIELTVVSKVPSRSCLYQMFKQWIRISELECLPHPLREIMEVSVSKVWDSRTNMEAKWGTCYQGGCNCGFKLIVECERCTQNGGGRKEERLMRWLKHYWQDDETREYRCYRLL